MESYKFHYNFDQDGRIDGWADLANNLVAAVNAFSVCFINTGIDGYTCNTHGDVVAANIRTQTNAEVLTAIMDDTYLALSKVPDPFAHVVGIISHLAQVVYEDDVHPFRKAAAHTAMLMVMNDLIQRHVEQTGFTAKA